MTAGRLIRLALMAVMLPLAAEAQGQPAGSALDAILARGTLRVGMTGDYRPFSIRDPKTGQYEGMDVDLAGNMAEALGVKLDIVPTSWGGLMGDLGAGRFDIGMGGISVTLDRAKTAFFSPPVLRSGKTPIALCTAAARFQTLDQIDQPGVTVITNPGGTNERFDRAHLSQAHIVVAPSNLVVFDDLLAGHADVMITDAEETRLQHRLHPQLCAIHPDRPFDFSEKAYLLPRDEVWKEWVGQWVHQEIGEGEFARVTAKWLD